MRLHGACEDGNLKLVLKYLSEGDVATVDEKDDYWKFTPLHYASMWGHDDIVTLLLQHKVLIDVVGGPTNKTALMLAACYGRVSVVSKLCIAGASLEIKSNDGNTALILAAMNGHSDVCEVLIASGAKDVCGYKKYTAKRWVPMMELPPAQEKLVTNALSRTQTQTAQLLVNRAKVEKERLATLNKIKEVKLAAQLKAQQGETDRLAREAIDRRRQFSLVFDRDKKTRGKLNSKANISGGKNGSSVKRLK